MSEMASKRLQSLDDDSCDLSLCTKGLIFRSLSSSTSSKEHSLFLDSILFYRLLVMKLAKLLKIYLDCLNRVRSPS